MCDGLMVACLLAAGLVIVDGIIKIFSNVKNLIWHRGIRA